MQEMSATNAPAAAPPRPRLNLAARFAAVVLCAFLIGWMLNGIATQMDRGDRPAGFARGLVQGALMPASLPNLLIGHDVAIYSLNNNGVLYKLGYTTGVNACGAIFFGVFYRRLTRWREKR